MVSKWAVAGALALGLFIVSPKARQHLGNFLDEMAKEKRRREILEETERRKAALDEIFARLQTSLTPSAPPVTTPALPAQAEPDAHWRDVIISPAIALILGKRGSGKSALAFRLLELFRYRLTPYVVGAPTHAGNILPDWIGTVSNLEDLPPDCIALIDEAYIHFHARRSMAQESKAMSQLLNLSRQRNQTLIFVSQEARQVDRNIASSASVVVIKDLGILQQEFDRPELKKLVHKAGEALAGVGKDKRPWAFVYSPDADHEGILGCQLPSFWKPSLSQLYAAETTTRSQRPIAKMTPQEKAVRAQDLRAKGYSYGQIMKELGVSKSTVVNYLKGYPYRSR